MKLMVKTIAVTTLALTAVSPSFAQGQSPFTIAESGKGFYRLSDAVEAVGGRTATIMIASGSYGDCASQLKGNITYRAVQPGGVIFDGGICAGKGTLVLKGQSATIDGIIFQNQRVPEGNGAGIRLEKGNLTIHNSTFRNADQGILTAIFKSGHISIDRSTFSRLGRCDRGLACAHSIYIGAFASLKVTNSRFEKGNGGHYIKSRAPKIIATNNSFDDSQGRTTNYMIDLPEGATGVINNNFFVQGQDKENYSAFIAVAAKRRTHRSGGLNIHSNTASFAKGVSRKSFFVANWSNEELRIANNNLGNGLTRYQAR